MTKKSKKARKARQSRYGYPVSETLDKIAASDNYEVVQNEDVVTDANTTSYGGKRFRTGYVGDKFTHPAGTKPKAVILDIDGTLQDWGSSTVSKGMAFAKRHHEAGDVLIVVTARDHEFMYESSFNWLMHNLPYPFIGPFMRSKDDPRTAGEFKRELAESLEAIYELVGAADDNNFVCDMWDEFALTRPGFESERCGYTPYPTWRRELPSKSYSSGPTFYTGSTSGYVSSAHPGETWVQGHWDKDAHEWITGHWEKDAEPKHRPAGQRSFADLSEDKAWGKYLDKRESDGAYMGIPPVEPDEAQAEDTDQYREELEGIVAHAYPTLTPEEIADMSIKDMEEQIGFAGDEIPERPQTREGRVQWRLDTEDDVYAEYGTLTRMEVEALDMVWLERLWDFALKGRPTEEALADYAETALLSLCEVDDETAPIDVEVIEDLLDELGEEGHARVDEITEEAS